MDLREKLRISRIFNVFKTLNLIYNYNKLNSTFSIQSIIIKYPVLLTVFGSILFDIYIELKILVCKKRHIILRCLGGVKPPPGTTY